MTYCQTLHWWDRVYHKGRGLSHCHNQYVVIWDELCKFAGVQAQCAQVCAWEEIMGGSIFTQCISVLLLYQHISWRSESSHERVLHSSLRLNAKHAADTAWEVFLLCFILFPHHYILTLTFGCDKRKALNPTHIHSEFQPLDPNSTPTLQYTTRLLRSSWTMLGFRLDAWDFFTLPITSICNANDWLTVFLSPAMRGCIFSIDLCPSMFLSSWQTTVSFPLYSALQLHRHCNWSCIKAPDGKRSCMFQLSAECDTVLIENVISKTIYTFLLMWHQMGIMQENCSVFTDETFTFLDVHSFPSGSNFISVLNTSL